MSGLQTPWVRYPCAPERGHVLRRGLPGGLWPRRAGPAVHCRERRQGPTPEAARGRAKAILGAVAHGHDPALEKATERGTLTIAGLADRFMSEHVEQKRKPGTVVFYRHLLNKIIKPEPGASKADKVTRAQVAKLHGKLKETPFQA